MESGPEPRVPLWEGRPDPAPLAWLDDDDRMAGRMPPEGMFLYAAIFLVATVFCARAAIASGAWGAGVFVVVLFGGLGSWLLWGGVVRIRWRRRHPGVDPSSTVRSWTGGSVFGSDRRSAGVLRWVLLVVCVLLALMAVLTLVESFLAPEPGGSAAALWGGRVLVALLLLLFLAVARADLRRIRALRGTRR